MWSRSDEFNRYYVAVVFLTLCLSSLFTESIGIHAFFGAFVFGIVLPRQGTLFFTLAIDLLDSLLSIL